MDRKLSIVMYHYTRDLANSRYPAIKGLDKELFRQQLDFFQEKFQVVTMEQVMEAWNSPNGSLPDNALLLTFDDGYIDNFTVAMPLLQERHMQGTFFIPGKTIAENVLLDVNKIHFILASADIPVLLKDLLAKMDYYRGDEFDYPQNDELLEKYAVPNRFDVGEVIFIKRMLQTVLPERLRNMLASELFEKYVGMPEDKFARELYMNHDQIRFMKDAGMHIGFHGYDHYWLANLSEAEMQKDIDKGLEVIGEYLDTDNWVIAYPYGNYSDAVCEYIKSRGCRIGLTVEAGIADQKLYDALRLPRLDCNDFPPKSENYRKETENG